MRELISFAVLALFAAALQAADAPEAKPDVAALIKQLSDDNAAVREAATKALSEMGAGAVDPVDQARKATKDEDLRLRCDIILKRIAEKTGATPESLAADRELKLPTSRVTLEFDKASAEDVLAELAKQSGNAPIKLLNDPMKRKKVSISVRDTAYWEAFDKICEALHAVPQFQGPDGMMLIPRGKVQDIGAYAGPASVKLLSCSRRATKVSTKYFRLPGAEGNARTEDEHAVEISYSCSVEDRLPVLSSRVQFDHARTGKGLDLTSQAAQTDAVPAELGPDAMGEEADFESIMGPSESTATFVDKDPADPGPLTLEGAVKLSLAVGRKELRIENAFAADHKPVVSGPYTLRLKDLVRNAGMAVATLEVAVKGDASLIHRRAPDGAYGFRLVDPKGAVAAEISGYSFDSPNGSTSSTGENIEFRLRPFADPEAPGPATATLKITFARVGADEGNWTLVLVHPERIETRSYPFTIKDVPLP